LRPLSINIHFALKKQYKNVLKLYNGSLFDLFDLIIKKPNNKKKTK